jgi:A/G-specific adenine glycosylase
MVKRNDAVVTTFQEGILTFWDQYGRHDLSWRQTRDPWKLLVAEVLLRKTTSTQAARVYDTLSNFSPADFTRTKLAELESILTPLGIYKVRATQLKEIACAVEDVSNKECWSDEFLRSLPGVGRYISNVVRCCAFGRPVPALDANMIRIIQRVFNWVSRRKRPREDRDLWAFAETLVPEDKCREFNWGVLDLGALVCTHRRPKCTDCTIKSICDYHCKQKVSQSSHSLG